MDYGAHLKKVHSNLNSRSKHYTKQSKFKGSDRQIRGAIFQMLTSGSTTRRALHKSLAQFEDIRIDAQLERLLKEGMIAKVGQRYTLPD